jgi:multicomponent Na+:H+ antiporter subunit F
MIALAACMAAMAVLALSAVRLFIGPTLQDRVLAFNAVVLICAAICAAMASAAREGAWIDAAFALVIAAYAVDVAVLKFFRQNSFQAPLAHPQDR